jgi:hypothetical protein
VQVLSVPSVRRVVSMKLSMVLLLPVVSPQATRSP